MIASDKYKYAFPCIPKNGTLSVRRWLITYLDGKQVGAYHQDFIPEKRKGYFRFITVRHPEDRLWSWFHWERYQIRVDRRGRGKQFEACTDTFEAFLRFLISRRGKEPTDPYNPQECMTQFDYYDKLKPNTVIKLENLQEGIEGLPFYPRYPLPPLKHLRPTPGKPPRRPFTFLEKNLIQEYCSADFEAFGYHSR